MQKLVSGVGHHESKGGTKRVQLVSGSWNFMCFAKRFNAAFNDNFPKFYEWNRGLIAETLLPKFTQNLFTYAEGYEVRVLSVFC